MTVNTNIYLTLSQWAEQVIMIWIERMAALGVNNAYLHAESFKNEIISNANGDAAKIQFGFEYILKFTDMGVGKGVSFADRGNGDTRRVQKQWFTKTFLLEVKKLGNIMADLYGYKANLIIMENLSDNSNPLTKI